MLKYRNMREETRNGNQYTYAVSGSVGSTLPFRIVGPRAEVRDGQLRVVFGRGENVERQIEEVRISELIGNDRMDKEGGENRMSKMSKKDEEMCKVCNRSKEMDKSMDKKEETCKVCSNTSIDKSMSKSMDKSMSKKEETCKVCSNTSMDKKEKTCKVCSETSINNQVNKSMDKKEKASASQSRSDTSSESRTSVISSASKDEKMNGKDGRTAMSDVSNRKKNGSADSRRNG